MAKRAKLKDVKGAKARGLLSAEDVKVLRARYGAKRVCVSCGRQFKAPDQVGTRMFGCGCCAIAHMRANPDRQISKGDRVSLIWLGLAGQVVGFTKEEDEILAVIDTEIGGRRYAVPSDQVERVHDLTVEHMGKCRHGKVWKGLTPKTKEDDDESDEDGTD